LTVLDGVDVCSGVAFEMGFAGALKRPIIGLKTDYGGFSKLESVNLTIEAPITKMCKSPDEALKYLQVSKHGKK